MCFNRTNLVLYIANCNKKNLVMPRKYVPMPGAKRRTHTYPQLQDAIDAIKDGSLSLSEASKQFKIPRTTLHDR